MQSFEPSFQMADLQELTSFLYSDPNSTAADLSQLKQQGLSPLAQANATYFAKLGKLAGSSGSATLVMPSRFLNPNLRAARAEAAHREKFRSATYDPGAHKARLARISWARATMNLPTDDGGVDAKQSTGYSCQDDSAAQLAYAVAVATITVMCYASVIGAPICTATVGLYLTVGGAGWGFGHALKCGFPS